LCLDKKEILMAQLEACERLSKVRADSTVIDMEITELKMALYLIS